jgi:hypothetical protein
MTGRTRSLWEVLAKRVHERRNDKHIRALEATVKEMAGEEFGRDERPFGEDDPLDKVLIYHDLRQVLSEGNIQEELSDIATRVSSGDDRWLPPFLRLNNRVEGMRVVEFIAGADQEDLEDRTRIHADIAFLDATETTRLRAIIELFRSIRLRLPDGYPTACVPPDTSALQRCITRDVIRRYLSDLRTSGQWLRADETLLNYERAFREFEQDPIKGMATAVFARAVFDDNHYVSK